MVGPFDFPTIGSNCAVDLIYKLDCNVAKEQNTV
jgi:hypothetical protein